MSFLGKLRRQKDGVGSIIGAIFVILILLSGIAFYAASVNINDKYFKTLESRSDLSRRQNQEKITINKVTLTATNNLNITVKNDGAVQSHLIWIGVFNKSVAPESHAYYPLDVLVDAAETESIVTTFTVDNAEMYIIQLVSELGNTIEAKFYSASEVRCALTLVSVSPTAYQGNNIAMFLTVTNNDTEVDTIQNITVSLIASPPSLVSLKDQPSSLTAESLRRGESAFFRWIYAATNIGTVMFNATYNKAPSGAFSTSNISILPAPSGNQGQVTISGTNASATYHPTQLNLLGGTSNVSGTVSSLASNDNNSAVFRSYYTGNFVNINHFVNSSTSNVDGVASIGTHINFTAMQYGPDGIFDTLTEAATVNYAGLTSVTAVGSIPNDMDRDHPGFMGAVFFNPTDNAYTATRVEFNASSATNQVFNSVSQGAGASSPTSGWVNDGTKKVAYWTGTVIVQPHTSQEFYVTIDANSKSEVFTVQVRITASGQVYSSSYTCEQTNSYSPWSFLQLGNQTTPAFTTTTPPSTEQTYYVSLQECGDRTAINSGGTLTIVMPVEFTNLKLIGGTGWGTGIITNNVIQVTNTQSVRNGFISFAFNATAPANPGLYMLNVSYAGTPNTQAPVGNFSIQVTGSRSNWQLDLEAQWTNVDYTQSNIFLCVYLGSQSGIENISVDVWTGGAWQNVLAHLSTGWNNVSVSPYLTSSTFTIRFKDAQPSDANQDSWNMDAVLLHLWSGADQYTAGVEFTGSSNVQNWTSLLWQIASSWDIGQVTVTIQLYNFTLGGYATSGNGYLSYISNATPNINELKTQTESSRPNDFRDSTGNWRVKITGIKAANTQFLMKVDWIEYTTTYSTSGNTIPYGAWQWYTVKATTANGDPIPYAYVSIYANGTNVTFRNATDGTDLTNPIWVHSNAYGTLQIYVKSASGSSETFVLYAVVGNMVGQKTVTQEAP